MIAKHRYKEMYFRNILNGLMMYKCAHNNGMMAKTELNFEIYCHRNTKHANRLILLYNLEKKQTV